MSGHCIATSKFLNQFLDSNARTMQWLQNIYVNTTSFIRFIDQDKHFAWMIIFGFNNPLICPIYTLYYYYGWLTFLALHIWPYVWHLKTILYKTNQLHPSLHISKMFRFTAPLQSRLFCLLLVGSLKSRAAANDPLIFTITEKGSA